MKKLLNGKKILFFYMGFYHYNTEIIKEIEKQGAIITSYNLSHYSLKYKILIRLGNDKFLNNYHTSFYRRILNKLRNSQYDYIFFLQGFQLNYYFLDNLKLLFSNSSFILYNWDPINSFNYMAYKNYFDKIFSFDPIDCQTNTGLNYLPLFYTKHFENIYLKDKCDNKQYDIVFVASASKERCKFVLSFRKYINNNLRFYTHLYISKSRYLKSLLSSEILQDVKFYPLNLNQIVSLYASSVGVIDYPNSNQQGLTMRTFEVLASGLKLITTNQNIKNEPFYDKRMIMVVQDKEISFDLDFLKTPTPSSFRQKIANYSLENWVKNIFNS